jgi:outer membrane receptor protein involved in Fe transport
MVKRTLFVVLALLLVAAIPAFAQTTSTITGTVTSDGKPLPGATVTISSPQMQGTRTAISGEAGGYNFGGIPPGTYTVKFELEGLKTVMRTQAVGVGLTAIVNADMKVTAVSEAITVTAAAPAVLETTQVAANIPQKLLNDLPAGRTVTSAVSLAPGVTAGVGGFSISGAPSFENLYLVNGVTVSENVRGQPHNLFIEDAIQETTVTTAGSISAEYGRFAGGVVNTITKSGGNSFTGSYRDTMTSPKWVSKTPIETASHSDVTNQVHELTLGGYAIKDRLWFFGAGRKAKVATSGQTLFTLIPYVNADTQKRYEAKLTGQLTPKHSLVGSYLKISETELNNNFNTQGADLETLVPSRQLPNDLKAIFYNGILTSNVLLEAGWTKKYFAFINSGSPFTDFVHGTLLRDLSRGVRFGSPTFCGVCDTEQRNNKSYQGKLSYFLNSSSLGTHSLVGGIENFDQMRFANNHQSGSDYRFLTSTASKIVGDQIYPVINNNGTSELVWTAIFNNASFGHFKTQSAFLNDKWDFNSHFSFNGGIRYDKNNAVDGNGNKISDDSAFSPRLGATYDVKANGRSRVNVSFARYVGALAENIGESFASAGQPAYIEFNYTGPTINVSGPLVDKYTALATIQNWFFNTIGGPQAALHNSDVLLASSVPGLSTVLTQKLVSPHADEWTVGYGQQIGANGFARADYVHRDYKDYYGTKLDVSTGTYADPFTGARGDRATVINDSDIKRNYHAVQFQGQWRSGRYSAGSAYTFASTKGNTETETGASGPVSVSVASVYPEFLNYANRVPYGRLTGDVRHRARLWVGYDLPMPSFLGRLNLSALHQYNSGLPYSAIGTVDPTGRNANFRYTGAPCTGTAVSTCTGNPGYTMSQLSNSQSYYFSGRGEFQTPALHSTDLSLNWDMPITKVAFFVKGEVFNAFNRHAVTTPSTSVITRRSGGSATGLAAFNPFTATPVECPQGNTAAQCTALGANWQKATTFGTATSLNSYQAARTYRLGVGLRF